MRVLPLLLALVLGGATAFAVSCGGGGDRSNLIPQTDADRLTNALDAIASATKAGDCTAAEQAVTRAQGVLVNLPIKVDPRLRSRLRQGIANLRDRVPQDCQKQTTTDAPTTTQAPTAPETLAPTQTETTPAPTQTETTPPTPTTTTPPPTETVPGDTTGGTGVLP